MVKIGLCCCLNLQKGVVTIGVISLLSSSVYAVMNLVMSVTFEEHVSACRQKIANDVLMSFPPCEALTDASLLMAVRVFIYIQVLVWVTEIITSALLIIAALKKQTNLMIPWVIVTLLVLVTMAWNIYEASSSDNVINLILSIVTFVVAIYFLLVVRTFGVNNDRTSRRFPSHEDHHACHRSTTSIQTLPTCFEYSEPSSKSKGDLPPAYTPFASSKKGPIPKGLGVRY